MMYYETSLCRYASVSSQAVRDSGVLVCLCLFDSLQLHAKPCDGLTCRQVCVRMRIYIAITGISVNVHAKRTHNTNRNRNKNNNKNNNNKKTEQVD